MNILITGARGFVGSALCKYIDGLSPWVEFGLGPGEGSWVDYAVDLTDSVAVGDLSDIFPEIDCVIHTAAMSKTGDCEKDVTRCRDINVYATSKLARTFPRAKFILFSTYAVYNTPDGNATEETVVEVTNEYIRSKLDAEKAVRLHSKNHLILRPSVIYGPSDGKHPNYFTSLMKTLDSGQVVKSAADQFFNPIYVDVICEVVRASLEKGLSGVYNVGSNEAVSKYDFSKAVMATFGYDSSRLTKVTGEDEDGVKRPMNGTINSAKIQKDVGYTIPSFTDMIRMLKKNTS